MIKMSLKRDLPESQRSPPSTRWRNCSVGFYTSSLGPISSAKVCYKPVVTQYNNTKIEFSQQNCNNQRLDRPQDYILKVKPVCFILSALIVPASSFKGHVPLFLPELWRSMEILYFCYLSKVLRNYTEQACDGDFLSVRCPPRTTITVQSAFYGRKGASDPQQCPQTYQALLSSYNPREDDRYCSVSTALQKMLDECQDRRSCQVLVNSRVFGTDQCPGSSKYLIVWYKCRPNEYKSKVVCEEERMRLSCKRGMQIAVYSAMFGRTQQGTLECPLHHRRAPSVDCQSSVALQVLTARCQGKKSCLVRASTRDFGDPCYSGTRKYLSVIYTCVPKKLLQEQGPRPPVYSPPPSAHDPNIVGDSPPEGSSVKRPDTVPDRKKIRETNPNEEKFSEPGGGESPLQPPDMNPIINSTSSPNMALISNALAAYTYISDHPERAALFFVCGVCLGLFLTLFALVIQISCRTDCQPRQRPPAKKRARPADSSSDSSDSDSDWDTTSDLSARRHRRFERTLNMNVFTSAEELERAQRLEERERIIREIWMNGQPDIPGTRSLNRYY
ncbi:protein eva-1 homolog C isoform X1 [Acanthopagrus latus]|uniref:protein eva-1 homolog C isoform X1 n=4 Tax=Acanthopagrus latus TaxID=8177 RepID=UPI00187CDDDE|nr:protein eva-1 homolog C isoform X1 [Acanthopagrus latus]